MELPLLVLGDLPRRRGPRPNQAHVAREHVPQLRPLVDAPAAHEGPNAGTPRLVAHLEDGSLGLILSEQLGPRLTRARPHRPELLHRERSTAPTHAHLSVQWRAAAVFD